MSFFVCKQRGEFNFALYRLFGTEIVLFISTCTYNEIIMNLLPIERVNEQSFICCMCQLRLSSKAALDRHLRMHAREKTFVCKICLKRFATKESLNRHLRVHTGIRPYICEVCERCFTSKGTLDKHLKSHVKDKNTCQVCRRAV